MFTVLGVSWSKITMPGRTLGPSLENQFPTRRAREPYRDTRFDPGTRGRGDGRGAAAAHAGRRGGPEQRRVVRRRRELRGARRDRRKHRHLSPEA